MTKTKKITIISQDMRLGGIQKKVIDIINYLQKFHPEIEITLYLRYKNGFFLEQIPSSVKILGPKFHPPRLEMVYFTFWIIFQFLKFRPTRILAFMDLVSVPTILALKILFWQKAKLTIGEDILTSKYVYTETLPQLRLKLIQRLYPHAENILVQTNIQKLDLEKIIGQKLPKITVSPNWLPLDYPPSLSQHTHSTDILFIGRFENQKNLPKFIKIVADVSKAYPQLKVKLIGDGSKLAYLQKLVKNMHLNHHISIIPPTLNPQKYYLDAKIFLLTSDYEGFPLTLMEAVSCGCYPIINSLPEIDHFFTEYQNKIIFNNNHTAVKLIKTTLKYFNPQIVSHYQDKLILMQQKNIKKYINYCIS